MTNIFKPGDKLYGTASLNLGDPAADMVDAHLMGNEPQVLTLNLTRNITPVSPETLTPDFEVVGVLQFGGGGAPYVVEIDMLQGVQLSVLASRVLFSAQVRSIPPGIVHVNHDINGAVIPLVTVTASVGAGVVAHGTSPQRTISDNNPGASGTTPLAVGDTAAYLVPPFAKSFRVYTEPTPAVLGVDLISVSTLKHGSLALASFPSAEIPLAADTRVINVTNNGANPVTGLRLIFALAL